MKGIKKIILASNNKHKVNEIKDMLIGFPYEIISLKEAGIDIDVEEDGKTFEENAYKKAKTIMEISGEITLADDSGLEVFALDNAPGVYSARFAGEHGNDRRNNEKLLEMMESVEDSKRGARFVCVMALVFPDGRKIIVNGYSEGMIIREEIGDNGFGYDPLFLIPKLNKTFAQLTSKEKNAISHRYKALESLKRELENLQ